MNDLDERARKILDSLHDIDDLEKESRFLAVELRSVVEEQVEFSLKMLKAQLKLAKSEAYADAAKIAWEFDECPCHGSPVHCRLALAVEAIRAKAEELK